MRGLLYFKSKKRKKNFSAVPHCIQHTYLPSHTHPPPLCDVCNQQLHFVEDVLKSFSSSQILSCRIIDTFAVPFLSDVCERCMHLTSFFFFFWQLFFFFSFFALTYMFIDCFVGIYFSRWLNDV